LVDPPAYRDFFAVLFLAFVLLPDRDAVFLLEDRDAVLVLPFLAVFLVVAIMPITPDKGRAKFQTLGFF
jgi:hypothetical protein